MMTISMIIRMMMMSMMIGMNDDVGTYDYEYEYSDGK